MLKIFFKILILLFVVVSVFSVVSRKLDNFFVNDFMVEKPFWVMNQRNKEYDFGVIGSSRAENMIDIVTMEAQTGSKGINLAVQGTSHAGLYLMLNHFLGNGNKLKLLLVQVDEYSFDSKNSYTVPFQVYEYLPYIADSKTSEIIKDNSDNDKFLMWSLLPFTRYIEFNSYYINYLSNYIFKGKNNDLNNTKGTSLVKKSHSFVFDKTTVVPKKRNIDDNDIRYLDKIVELANNSNTRVILFTAPQYYEILPYLNTHKIFLNIMKNKYNSLPYINYEFDILSKEQSLFNDVSHLNNVGSILFSKKLSLIVNAVLSDR